MKNKELEPEIMVADPILSRVTELMARPIISVFFPELKDFIQPLSGEYGGRRSILEKMQFFSGYGVEMALLIQAVETLRAEEIGQVYLWERTHKLQEVPALGRMSACILHTVLDMAYARGRIGFMPDHHFLLRQYISEKSSSFKPIDLRISNDQLPPMNSVSAYLNQRVSNGFT